MSNKRRPVVGIMTGQFSEDSSIRFLNMMIQELEGSGIDIRFYFGGVSTLVLEKYDMSDIGFGCHHYSLFSYCNYEAPDAMVMIFGSINVGQKQHMEIHDFIRHLPRVPVILLKEDTGLPENPGSISINMDNYDGMKKCVVHLLETHNVKIPGYISGPADHSDSRLRLAAYKDALEEHGIPYDESLVVYGDYVSHVDSLVEELFAAHPEMDAVISANDEMATAVYRVASKHGRTVGHDLLVTGFDNIPIAAHMEPPLTTVYQDYAAIAKATAEELKKLVSGQEIATKLLPATFIPRCSCGCCEQQSDTEAETADSESRLMLMDTWLNASQSQMRSMVLSLILRELHMSTSSMKVFFEKLAEEMIHLKIKSSIVCLLWEPATMQDGEMIDAPESIGLVMRQWGDAYEAYDLESAPKIGFGQMTDYIRPANDAVHMTDFILFHGREQYGIWSAEIDVNDALFYEMLSLEIGSALYSLKVSLEQQKLRSDLETKNRILDYAASHDQLTGALNRTGIMKRMIEFIKEKRQNGICSFLAVMADLDHLKQINDNFGHQEGDSAIVTSTDIIKKSIPEGSPFGRTGGDEFMAIMECSSPDGGERLKVDIKKACDQYNLYSGKDYYVDLSIGYCLLSESEDVHQLINIIKKADEMLYESKKHRRESVVRVS